MSSGLSPRPSSTRRSGCRVGSRNTLDKSPCHYCVVSNTRDTDKPSGEPEMADTTTAKASISVTLGGVVALVLVVVVVADNDPSPLTLLPFCVTAKVTDVPARIAYLTLISFFVTPLSTDS